jgi:hypothetical protein
MKPVQYLLLCMLLFHSCSNHNFSLEMFKDCYSDEKFNRLEQAVKVLDNEMQTKFPADNLKLSYKSFAIHWLENNGKIEGVLKDSQILEIHQLLEQSGVLKDLSQQELVNMGTFYLCLNQANDSEVEKYLELRENLGSHLQMSIIVSGMYEKSEGILAFIFKVEYLLNEINS